MDDHGLDSSGAHGPDEPVAVGSVEPPDAPADRVAGEDLDRPAADVTGVFGRGGEVSLSRDVDSESHVVRSSARLYHGGFLFDSVLAKWYNLS